MSSAHHKYLIEEYIPGLLKQRCILEEGDPNDYVIKSCQILPVTTDGTFMFNNCSRVKLDLQQVGHDENVLHLDLVIKLTPPELASAEMFELMAKKTFRNEIFVYTKVLPQLTHIGYYPRYYYGHVGDINCSLVLSDFGIDGWRMAPTLTNLSLEHILLTVKCLGRFHGNCYAMKEMNTNEFQDIVQQLSKTRFEQVTTGDAFFDEYIRQSPQRGIRAVTNSVEYQLDEAELKRVAKLFSEPSKLCQDLVLPVEPLAIICHGDFLRNNIAFKYEGESPVDVMMFDFQTMCYTSPMMDLVTFMSNSTGKDVRVRHFEEIFRAYHSALINVLCEKRGGSPAELPEHFSYANFLREYLRMLPFGYVVASTFIHMLHSPLKGPIAQQLFSMDMGELLKRGGNAVDQELASLFFDICELTKKFGRDLSA